MNGPHIQPGGQPASGGINSGYVTGGFEMVSSGMGLGGGAGLSPPGSTVGGLSMTDITLEQALVRMQDLMRENGELREYLKENNEMMKRQFDTLSQWKQKVHDANVLNREKFEQTRALITALRSENEELQVKVRDSSHKEDLLSGKIKTLEAELNALKMAKAASDQLAFNVVKQAEQQGVEVGDEETQMRETLAYNVVKQAEQQWVEVGDEETQMRETVYVASADKEERIVELEEEVSKLAAELEQMRERSGNLEHDNTQFRSNTEHLLKDLETTQHLKQEIQRENQDLRQETVELRQQLQSMLADTKNSLQRNPLNPLLGLSSQLGHNNRDTEDTPTPMPISGNNGQDGSMGRTPNATIDDWQETSAVVTAEVEQLRRQLEEFKEREDKLCADLAARELEISQLQGQLHLHAGQVEALRTQHTENLRQLQSEHDSHFEQMERQKMEESLQQQAMGLTATHAEDVQTLRSQVLTLINEVHETQNKLSAAQRTIETKNTRLKELETYSTQVVGESRNRLQQLQQALAMGEKQLVAEQQDHGATKQQMNDLRKSFNQLVSDYKEVLDTFDQYKTDQEQRMRSNMEQRQQLDTISHLTAQVVAAEEAINLREGRVHKLQQDVREKEETMAVLQAQAEVYKSDFLAEREARSRLATEKERVSQELEAEQLKAQGLVDQLTRYTQQQLHTMQLRASQGSAAAAHYLHPTFSASTLPRQPLHHPYQGGGGGDGGGGGGGLGVNYPPLPPTGSYNNLSMAEAGERNAPPPPTTPVGGQNYPGGQNFHQPGLQNFGQLYGGGQYPGARGAYPVEGRGMAGQGVPVQAALPEGWYGEVHGQYPFQPQSGGGGGGGASSSQQPGHTPRQQEEDEPMLYICPSCNQRLPDYDTLSIHVQDCLEHNSTDAHQH
ncbi:hypothetical protein ACOMHN_048410 [Nucella lapillus]